MHENPDKTSSVSNNRTPDRFISKTFPLLLNRVSENGKSFCALSFTILSTMLLKAGLTDTLIMKSNRSGFFTKYSLMISLVAEGITDWIPKTIPNIEIKRRNKMTLFILQKTEQN